MKVLVCGSGTAGLITAITLKKRLNIDVSVVSSKEIGIVGVGEGSTEHFKEFCTSSGISFNDIIKECDATFKAGIMFEGWGKKTYFHNVGGVYSLRSGQYNFGYAKQIVEEKELNSKHIWDSLIDVSFLSNTSSAPFNQFHFNTFKLNEFLTKKAKEIGVIFFEDEIQDVEQNESGNIVKVIGKNTAYVYDFYIDSTGFRRLLHTKLGAKWESFSKYLTMNSAIAFRTPDTEEYKLWTLAKAMSAGWLFRIPTWGSHGNGYIYNNKFITKEDAIKELEALYGFEVSIGREFTFDPGKVDKAWIKNCVAVGLSGSFFEPLEATSIGTSIQQAFLLMHLLPGYNEKSINLYNKSFDSICYNIRDFVFLHYMGGRSDTDFWKSIDSLEIPNSLYLNLEKWKDRLPIQEDFINESSYIMFLSQNFIVVLDGLGLINYEKVKNNHEMQSTTEITEFINGEFKKQNEYENSTKFIPHKEYLSIIRNYF
jgi:hypothetical protein